MSIRASIPGCFLVLLAALPSLAQPVAAPVPAQGPAKPAPGLAAPAGTDEAMAKFRAGEWQAGDPPAVVKALFDGGFLQAAEWWLAAAEDAGKAGKLAPAAKRGIAQLRTEWKKSAAPPAEHVKLADEAVKSLDLLVKTRNWEAARLALPAAAQAAAEFPDARRPGIVERARKDVLAHASEGDTNPKLGAEHRKLAEEMARTALPVFEARLERGLAEYAAAGCAPGRVQLRQRILAAYGTETDPLAQKHLRGLFGAARTLEPSRLLDLWIIGEAKQMALYREEGPSAVLGMDKAAFACDELRQRQLRVFPGDVIRLAPWTGKEVVEKTYDGTSIPRNGFYAAQARIDGKDLPAECWSCIAKEDLERPDAKRQPVLFAKKIPWPDGLKPPQGQQRTDYALDLDAAKVAGKNLQFPFPKPYEAWEKEYADENVAPRWMMPTARDPVLVLTVTF